MGMDSQWDLHDKLSVLYQLCTGQYSMTFQYNLLAELQTCLHWDQAVLLAPEPWMLPLNEGVPFPVPDRSCPTGLWFCNGPFLPPQSFQTPMLPDPCWIDWGHHIAQHYHLQAWLLMVIDLTPQSPAQESQTSRQQMPILFLRKDSCFNEAEITLLGLIHDELQQIVVHFLMLESLLSHTQKPLGQAQKGIRSRIGDAIEGQDWVTKNDNREPLEHAIDKLLEHHLYQRYEMCIQESLKHLGLTPRQVQVMHLIIKGKGLTLIAQELGCTEATVRKHIENLYRRLGVQTRTAAIAQVLERIGIV